MKPSHNHNHLFSIPEIHQRGYKTCQYITTNTVQNESLQYNNIIIIIVCNYNRNNQIQYIQRNAIMLGVDT